MTRAKFYEAKKIINEIESLETTIKSLKRMEEVDGQIDKAYFMVVDEDGEGLEEVEIGNFRRVIKNEIEDVQTRIEILEKKLEEL